MPLPLWPAHKQRVNLHTQNAEDKIYRNLPGFTRKFDEAFAGKRVQRGGWKPLVFSSSRPLRGGGRGEGIFWAIPSPAGVILKFYEISGSSFWKATKKHLAIVGLLWSGSPRYGRCTGWAAVLASPTNPDCSCVQSMLPRPHFRASTVTRDVRLDGQGGSAWFQGPRSQPGRLVVATRRCSLRGQTSSLPAGLFNILNKARHLINGNPLSRPRSSGRMHRFLAARSPRQLRNTRVPNSDRHLGSAGSSQSGSSEEGRRRARMCNEMPAFQPMLGELIHPLFTQRPLAQDGFIFRCIPSPTRSLRCQGLQKQRAPDRPCPSDLSLQSFPPCTGCPA